MNRFLEKYKHLSLEAKSAFWYAVSNVSQKITPWLVMIILTRNLAVKEYGVYSVFISWLEIFEIIVTLRIYSSGYVARLVREDSKKEVCSATLQSLSYILVFTWLIIYILIHNLVNSFTEMSTFISCIGILSFLSTISFGLWTSRQRVKNNYFGIVTSTFLFGFLGPICGALSVFLKLDNPIVWVISIRVIIQLFISIPFCVSNVCGAGTWWDKSIALETLKYNIPLLPYYLSMFLLNQSDRVMIQKFTGYFDAALYCAAYSAAMIAFVVSGAINLSLQTWLFKGLKDYKKCDHTKPISYGTIAVSLCCLVEIALAPEIIQIIAGKNYLISISAMPPVVISVIVMYIYQQYVNVLFYFNKTGFILFCSVFSALINIVLNYLLIPQYGFVVAGYTTLISYLLVLVIYYIMMRIVCKENNIDYACFFNNKVQFSVLGITMIIALLLTCLYKKIIFRYFIFLMIVYVIWLCRKQIYVLMRCRKE